MVAYVVAGFVVLTVVPVVTKALWRGAKSFLRRKFKGVFGERKTHRALRKFRGRGFAREKNVLIASRGKSTQIDNLLVSRHGIFVIEVKNYAGIIKGRPKEPEWLQILPGSTKPPRKFMNPLLQNEGHINALRRVLLRSYPKVPFHNIVVFSDDCRSPHVPGVVSFSNLVKELKGEMLGPPVLSEKEVADISKIIRENALKTSRAQKEHVKYAKSAGISAAERRREEEHAKWVDSFKAVNEKTQSIYSGTQFGSNKTIFDDDVPALDSQIQVAAGGASAVKSAETIPMKEAVPER